MNFITVPIVCGIIVWGIYKLFELFVCKKERLTIIEKMGEKFTPDMLEHKINFSFHVNSSMPLRWGCLLVGCGLGLLMGFFIFYNLQDFLLDKYNPRSIVYGASFLLCGGLGLLVAFLLELKINKNK